VLLWEEEQPKRGGVGEERKFIDPPLKDAPATGTTSQGGNDLYQERGKSFSL
jgi:hypothetical protein